MIQNNRDFLFISDATLANPNGDPDMENRPRMDYDTKTLLVSDVRLKRNIRDQLANKGFPIFVNTLNDKKVTMEKMFQEVIENYGVKKKEPDVQVQAILENMIDIRMFGSALAVGKVTKAITGPIQISWGYSLHPVDLVKSNSIVTIMNDDNSTFGKMYKAQYAMIAHCGSINKFAAKKTGLTEEDVDIFRCALIQSMMNNLTHSKQGQKPLLYLEIEYASDFDGYLGDLRRFLDVNLKKEDTFRSIDDLDIDFERLGQAIKRYKEKGYISAVHIWNDPFVRSFQQLPEAQGIDLLKPIVLE